MAIRAIDVRGLTEFSRALKKMDTDLPKQLRVALNAAVNMVVAEAQPQVPKRTGKAAASIKASSTQSAARIKAGGSKAPYFPWLDFGGKRRGRGGGIVTRQFRRKGRYIWLAFGVKKKQVMKGLEDAIADAAKAAGLEVTRG